jgi:hypothetical protein
MTRRRRKARQALRARQRYERRFGRSREWRFDPRAYIPNLSDFPEHAYPTPCMHCGYDPRDLPVTRCPECGARRFRSRDLVAYYVRRDPTGISPIHDYFRQSGPEDVRSTVYILLCAGIFFGLGLLHFIFPDWPIWHWLPDIELPIWANMVFQIAIILVPAGVFVVGGWFLLRRVWRQLSDRGDADDQDLSVDRDLLPFGWRRTHVWQAVHLPKHAQAARDQRERKRGLTIR